MRAENPAAVFQRAPLWRVSGESFFLLTRTYHGSRQTVEVKLARVVVEHIGGLRVFRQVGPVAVDFRMARNPLWS